PPELRLQTPLPPERRPVVRLAVRLRQRADEVARRPPERRRSHPVQPRQRPTELVPVVRPGAPRLQPLQREPRGLASGDVALRPAGARTLPGSRTLLGPHPHHPPHPPPPRPPPRPHRPPPPPAPSP